MNKKLMQELAKLNMAIDTAQETLKMVSSPNLEEQLEKLIEERKVVVRKLMEVN